MDKIKINYSNLSRLKEVLKKYVLDKVGSRKFTGYASIDKPWEKGALFVPKKIKIPDTPYAVLALTKAKFNVTEEAIYCHEASITRDDMLVKSYRLAKALKAKGIKKGDIVCLSMNETIEASVIEAACSFIGAVSANIPANASREGIKDYLKRFNCKYYFTADQFRKDAEEAAKDLENVEICVCNSDHSFENISNLTKETKDWLEKCKDDRELSSNEISFDELMEFSSNYNGPVFEKLAVDDPAKILFTSGTSGTPKPILLSNGNINAELIRMGNFTHMALAAKGIALKVVSDMYPYGNIVSKWLTIYVGKAVGLTPALTSSNADFYIYFYMANFVFGIPSFFRDLKKYDSIRERGLKFWKYLISGGAKYPTADKITDNEFLRSVGCNSNILDGAGAGEITAGGTAHNELKYNVESVGKPLVGMNVKIIEDIEGKPFKDCKELKYNESGLICWSGETLMLEYYGMPEVTEQSTFYDENGVRWFVSDAIGHVDPKGNLYITSRKARCFTAFDEETGSAYKLSPEEVESTISDNPIIEDCVALPMTVVGNNGDENRVVKLYVRLKDGEVLTEDKKAEILKCFEESTLAKCSIPKKIEQWIGEWPMLDGAKIDYKSLQAISDEEEQHTYRK